MSTMLAILLIGVPGLALWVVLADTRGRIAMDWREALGVAALLWTTVSMLIAYLLSAGAGHDPAAPRTGHLTQIWMSLAWSGPALIGAIVLWRRRNCLVNVVGTTRAWLSAAVPATRVALAISLFCVAIVGVVAIVAAPNNWDSMTYHLARVAVWLELGGVTHFATTIDPQLYHPPAAEILIAQWQALTDGDRLAASVQWFAYSGSIAVASLAAARLGAGRFAQVTAALLTATMPMAIMQGSSTQNDLLLGFWLLIAATLLIAAPDRSAWRLPTTGLAIGLAIATKGTAMLFALPLVLVLAWRLSRCDSLRRALATGTVALVLIALPATPHWIQNTQTFGSPVSAGTAGNFYRTADSGPATIFANFVRGASNHLDLPHRAANRFTENSIRDLLKLVDIDPDDPVHTFTDAPFKVGPFGPHEDHAGNLLLMLLGAGAFGGLLTRRFRTPARTQWAVIIAGQILLFCALIKWQNWNARLHLPVFVLLAPLAAVWLGHLRRRKMALVALAVVSATAPLYLVYNYTRPIVGERSILTTGRESGYFLPRRNIESRYRGVVAELERLNASRVGIVNQIDDWVYPFHALGRRRKITFTELLSSGSSAKYATGRRWPSLIVGINVDPVRRQILIDSGYRSRRFISESELHDSRLPERKATVELFERSSR